MTIFEMQAILDRISYKSGWEFQICRKDETIYLQIEFTAKCPISNNDEKWKSRKWLMSEHMTDAEIVQTVFKAVMTVEEHEAREMFRFDNLAIYGPHLSLEALKENALNTKERE